jgi:hypothetical protein
MIRTSPKFNRVYFTVHLKFPSNSNRMTIVLGLGVKADGVRGKSLNFELFGQGVARLR